MSPPPSIWKVVCHLDGGVACDVSRRNWGMMSLGWDIIRRSIFGRSKYFYRSLSFLSSRTQQSHGTFEASVWVGDTIILTFDLQSACGNHPRSPSKVDESDMHEA